MKKILYTLALIVSFISFGQDDIKQGLVTEYYESGAVQTKVNYVDGKRQGEAISYYESGALKVKLNYVDGKSQGEAISYYESGALKLKLNYVDGKIQGEYTKYYESGALKDKVNFIDGKEQGEYTEYYESGALNDKGNYVDGQLQGEYIQYYESGAVQAKFNYLDGKQHNDYITSGDKKISDFEKVKTKNKIDEAINDYTSAILVDPKSPTGYYKRGWAYAKGMGVTSIDKPWMRACMDFVEAARLGNKDALDWIKCTSYEPEGSYRIFSDFYMDKYRDSRGDWIKNQEYLKEAIYWDSSYYLPYVANTEVQRKLSNYEGVVENADKAIELINLLPNAEESCPFCIVTLERYKKIALERISKN